MKVIKNYLYNVGYQILAIILPLVTAPYVNRTLGPKGVGIYSYTNSIIQWFVILAILGIDLYGQKQIASTRNDKYKMSVVFWEIQIMKTTTTIFSFLALAFFLKIYPVYSYYMLLQSLAILSVWLDISWLFMGVENFRITVFRNTIVKILSLVMIFLFVRTANDIGLYIIITGLAIVLGNFTIWPYVGKITEKVSFKDIHPWRHLLPTLSYFIPQNASQIYLLVNKNMLGFMENTTASGFYNNADNIIRAVLVIVTSVGTVMMPHIANEIANGRRENVYKYTYASLDFVSSVACAMMFGLSSIAIKGSVLFYGKGFEPVGPALIIESLIIVLIGWNNTVGTQFLIPMNKANSYTTSIVVGTILNVILNIPLIKLWGLNGAALSTVISEFLITAYQLFIVRKELKLKHVLESLLKYMIAGVIMFTVVFYMDIHMQGTAINLLLQIIAGAIIYSAMCVVLKTGIFNIVYGKFRNKNRRKS